MVWIEGIVDGVIEGAKNENRGSGRQMLHSTKGVKILPPKIPFPNANKRNGVASGLYGKGPKGFPEEVHVWVDGKQRNVGIEGYLRFKRFYFVGRNNQSGLNGRDAQGTQLHFQSRTLNGAFCEEDVEVRGVEEVSVGWTVVDVF